MASRVVSDDSLPPRPDAVGTDAFMRRGASRSRLPGPRDPPRPLPRTRRIAAHFGFVSSRGAGCKLLRINVLSKSRWVCFAVLRSVAKHLTEGYYRHSHAARVAAGRETQGRLVAADALRIALFSEFFIGLPASHRSPAWPRVRLGPFFQLPNCQIRPARNTPYKIIRHTSLKLPSYDQKN